ncbi:MAG: hypothetical protein DRQ55_14860 [Planctomycetota bacterium]|nr:MAG: hypothetical protein DRQ55_14860 [Planctomycetota bacterium]
MTSMVAQRYRVEETLGRGGMGEALAAFDETLQRRVVLKAVRSDRPVGEQHRRLFRREAQILSQLDHPAICRCHDLLHDGGVDYIVLERIDGITLQDALLDGLPRGRVLSIAAQILDALVAAHAAGIVHRDLKPANVMLTPSGQVKVLDFGLAQLVLAGDHSPADTVADTVAAPGAAPHHSQGAHTATMVMHSALGRISGTLLYMSPEQARGEAVGAATDLYSLGLMLQEMVSGRRPYPERSTRLELLARAQRGEPDALTGATGELRRLIESLQQRSPTLRPTAQAAARAVAHMRAAPARRTRWLAAGALALASVAAGIKYAVDLDHERLLALQAREAARSDRGRAEDLIGFMLGDLRSRLESLGRLDVLDAVGQRTMDYFRSIPQDSLGDDELLHRSQALAQIAGLRIDQGELPAARDAAAEAVTQARALVARRPADAQAIKNLGNAVFFVGNVELQLGQLPAAMRCFEEYQDLAEQLVQLQPDEPEWRQELAYAWTNLGALSRETGAVDEAIVQFRQALDVWVGLLAAAPDDPALLRELADVQSWLGSTLEDAGRSPEAIDVQTAELDARTRLLELEHADMTARSQLATVRQEFGRSLLSVGDERALLQFQAAYQLHAELAAHDPGNLTWKRDVAVALANLGDAQRALAQPALALEHLQRSLQLFDELLESEPANDEWRAERSSAASNHARAQRELEQRGG